MSQADAVRYRDSTGGSTVADARPQRAPEMISAVSAARAEAVAVVEEGAQALARVEPAQSCDAPTPQRSVGTLGPSFDDLIRPQQQRRRDGEPERFGGLEIDHELELVWLFDREVAGLGALEDFVDEDRRSLEIGGMVC
jgi:hypothetical protein